MTELKVESGVVDGASFEAARSRLLACDGVEMKLEAAADEEHSGVGTDRKHHRRIPRKPL